MLNENIGTTGSDNDSFDDSVLAQDQNVVARPQNPTLEQALTTYAPNTSTSPIRPRPTENVPETINLLNTLSRVSIAAAKYPDDATLHNYGNLQTWMFTHSNKRPPIDICQSLVRMFFIYPDHHDHHRLFNLRLICAEAYQTIGNVDQAYCEYDQAEILAKTLDDSIISHFDILERDRKRKKLEDIGMKLEFQSEFKRNLIERRKRQSFNLICHDLIQKLDMTCNTSADECPYIWRQIVLQFIIDPSIAIPGAKWLFSYADRLSPDSLPHANSLYVALNLLLYAHGPLVFTKCPNIDIFKMLDDIGRYFEENGNQSKQFSPVHKMAHVWGTAAVVFHLASDKYRYSVCACMMRVSFESLGICFLSSGIESLYILAREHAPTLFTMMANDPSIKLISPECINYFRGELENNLTCIRYSMETVDRFVSELFNLDQTEHRI